MGQAVPRQHPAVVLRSQYRQLRALLAVAMIAVVGLTAAVVILATNDDAPTSQSVASPARATGQAMAAGRGDGGPEESNVAAAVGSQPTAVGPDESTIAATIGSGSKGESVPVRPDESRVAAAISGRSADHRR
jgi:hypothetical protein